MWSRSFFSTKANDTSGCGSPHAGRRCAWLTPWLQPRNESTLLSLEHLDGATTFQFGLQSGL